MANEPIIGISPIFKGKFSASDLLTSEGAFYFITGKVTEKNEDILFQVVDKDFIFCLSIRDEAIIVQRNNTMSVMTLGDVIGASGKILIFVTWTHDEVTLRAESGHRKKESKVPTSPTAPPAKIIKWARKQSLIPVESYKSEEEFRERIHACLNTVNEKIHEADAAKSFWNITYDGNRIIDRKPKKEVEIQPLIHCFLSDQMLLSSIEVVPEYKTGEGLLDFLFIGQVENMGSCKYCAEFKLAHSADLENGLWNQLPKYMNVSNATYGAYCVLDFRCEWFELPNLKEDTTLDFPLTLIPSNERKPEHENIRYFIFSLGKHATASKKS